MNQNTRPPPHVMRTGSVPPSTEAWLAKVDIAGPVVEAEGAEGDRRRCLTDRAMAALHEQSLFRLLLPRAVGGHEVALPEFFAVIEAVARFDGSAAWCLCQGNAGAHLAAYLDPAVADEIWGGDPNGVLAWGPGKSEIRAVAGGYSVTARSAFVSGSHHATWLAAHCTAFEADGTPRLGPDGGPELRTALIPASEIELDDKWDAIGLRGSGSDSFALDDKFVPADHTIVRASMIEDRPRISALHGLPLMTVYAVGFAATALGIARGVLDAFIDLAGEKRQRGIATLLGENAVVQDEIARAEAKLSASRAFLIGAAEQGWHDLQTLDMMSLDQRMRIRLAGTYAIHEAKAAVDTLYDSAGTSAVMASSPFERRFRDIHTVALQIQGRKNHFQSVGGWLLGNSVNATNMSVI